MFKTLYGKLVFSLLLILAIVTGTFVTLTFFTAPLYQQEITQKLHSKLASSLVSENPLLKEKEVNKPALKNIFHNLMVINPSIEVYLTDTEGKILAFSAPPGKVKKEYIDLGPVKTFINKSKEMPILGDNPRDLDGKKVFSASPVFHNDTQEGYLYVVLGGEKYDSVVNMIKGSYILQFSVVAAVSAVLITLFAGIIIFNLITQRLRFLARVMEKFKKSDFQHEAKLPARFDGRPVDEIDQIGTTFREMSERITQQVKQLKATDASRRELVANVSHDLRTPLSSLQGYLETLALKYEELNDEERKNFIDISYRQSERLGRLISELFDLAMLENQTAPVHHEPFSLSELAQDVSHKFQLEAKQKNIQLTTELESDSPFVSADIALIERVLENLIENAIKYTPSGGNISLIIKCENNNLTTAISDNGPGIPEADIPHIFERFYRVDKSRQPEHEGTGLGLAIAKRILQLHDSIIHVDSQLDKGTQFSFSLPSSTV